MSFPNRYGSSPALPRDYGLVQSTSYSAPSAISEVDESQESPVEGSSLAEEEEEEESIVESSRDTDADQDNLSHLSIGASADGEGGTTIGAPTPTKKNRKPSSAQRSTSVVSVSSSSNHHHSSTGGRGIPGSASETTNAQDHHSNHILSTSFLLGGEPSQPPPTADLRTEEEAIQDGDGAEWEDNDRTPMPHSFHKADSWLSRPALTRGHLEQQQAEEHDRADANERTALISAGRDPEIQNRRTSGYHSISERSASGAHHYAPPGGGLVAPGASAWSNIGNFAQPLPPGPEQVQEIEREPVNHIRSREYNILTRYSLPVWGTHLLELSLNVVSVFSIGHLGTIPLAAASLSSMTANVTAFSLLSGFISALDSLAPPAFTQQPKRVGVYAQSMSIIVIGLLVPIALVWINAEKVLLALGQDAEVAKLSGLYLRVMLPGVPAYAGFEICRRYLQAQGLMSASTMVLLVVSPINAFLNWLLVWGPDSVRLGFVGAPLASAVSNWLMFLLGLGQCYLAPRTAWGGLSLTSALKKVNIMPCLSLGTYGFLAISSEWWAWEISSLITSMLGTTPLAAQSVLLVCSSITYQQPFAISVAVAVRVGNLLGAQKPFDAQVSSNAGLILSLLSGAFNSSLVMIFRRPIATLFSEDAEVIDLLTQTLPLLALFQIWDGVAGVAGGILRGTGRQHLGAYLNMVAYYVIALPLGAWITFSWGWGLEGMWVGLTIALAISSVGGLILCVKTDWQVELDKVQQRMSEGQTQSAGHTADSNHEQMQRHGNESDILAHSSAIHHKNNGNVNSKARNNAS
ncbi:unnamed protein product [Sympodiomycopsis kandeliae]